MLEAARMDLEEKLKRFSETAESCRQQLDKQRAAWLLACEWVSKVFHGRVEQLEVRAIPSEYGDSGQVSFRLILKNGESWSEILGLLELLTSNGVDLDKWNTSEDAPNFARTYSAYMHEESKAIVCWSITLALREGNLGGCRRVFIGKETDSRPIIRDKYVLICDDPPE